MFEDINILVVVPARQGSQGVKNKNMKLLGGKSLIQHAADCVRQLDWVDRAILSTDSNEYAEEGIKFGLSVPSLRPSEFAGSSSSIVDALRYEIERCESHYSESYDLVMLVEPTSPLRTAEDLTHCMKLFVEYSPDAVVAVTPLDKKYYPEKILKSDGDWTSFYCEEGRQITNRQELKEEYYFRNGVCYIISREQIFRSRSLLSGRNIPFLMEREVVNIDTEADLFRAEKLLSLVNRSK